ncbi:hypothetical protein SLA2020_324160 [Shorea laevis]
MLLLSAGITEFVSRSSVDAIPSHFPYKFKVVSKKEGGQFSPRSPTVIPPHHLRSPPPFPLHPPPPPSRSAFDPPIHFKCPPSPWLSPPPPSR